MMNSQSDIKPGNFLERVEIKFLADYPHFAEPLARYHYTHWHESLPWWTHDEALAELQNHARRRDIPTTLVAVHEGQLLGSASLVLEDLPEEDLPGFASLSPWLASVFILPAWRGQGLGSLVVEAVVAQAQVLGIPQIYLFTAGQELFYRRLGWSVLAQVQHHGEPGTVMVKQLSSS